MAHEHTVGTVEWACEECGRALDWDDVKHLIEPEDESQVKA